MKSKPWLLQIKWNKKIMMIMPIMIVGMLKMLGEDFAENFVTPTGWLATTIE